MTYISPVRRGIATTLRAALAALVCCCLVTSVFAQTTAKKQDFDIPAGEAKQALKQFAAQTNEQLLTADTATAGVKTNAVRGEMTSTDALDLMLANTGLKADYDAKTRSFAVRKETETERKNGSRLAQNDSSQPKNQKVDGNQVENGKIVLDTFEVFGRKTLNMDIQRTRDDAQPYVVFSRREIEQSGAVNVEEFLGKRLTMLTNTSTSSGAPTPEFNGSRSSFNLRGLGSQQTLVLVDGHRLPAYLVLGQPQQADLNGIPISAIERIETLPSTASAIYGGSATGGVINIILKRDYSGFTVSLGYQNTFDSDAAVRQASFTYGKAFNSGRTSIMLIASARNGTVLNLGDRNFVERSRAELLARNPTALVNRTLPILGATTNIISIGGLPLTLKAAYGGGSLNSSATFVPVNYAGPGSDNGAGLIANAGKQNVSLANTAQDNAAKFPYGIQPTVKAANLHLRHNFTPKIEGFVEYSLSRTKSSSLYNPAPGLFTLLGTDPSNPFNERIRVTTPSFGTDALATNQLANDRILAGIILRLPRDWSSEADYSWSTNRVSATNAQTGVSSTPATNAVKSGAIDVFKDTNRFPVDFSPFQRVPQGYPDTNATIGDLVIRASGPVWELNSTPVRVSALLERKSEAYSAMLYTSQDGVLTLYPDTHQTVESAYLEGSLPLFPRPEGASHPWLEFHFAGRFDRYSLIGATVGPLAYPLTTPIIYRHNSNSSVDPTLAVKVQPLKNLFIRGSYATGFVPPAVFQLVPSAPVQTTVTNVTDPLRGNQQLGTITFVTGGNPTLKPEKSEAWSGGLVFSPALLGGFRLSVDWTRIEKRDNISILQLTQPNVALEAFVPGLITRGSPLGDGFAVGPITGFNAQFLNFQKATSESVDFAAEQLISMHSGGSLKFSVNGTRILKATTQATPLTPVQNPLGTVSLVKWRLNASAIWTKDSFELGWTGYYYDGYWWNAQHTVDPIQGSDRVKSTVIHDAFLGYRFRAGTNTPRVVRSLLDGASIQVAVNNVGNTQPTLFLPDGIQPFVNPQLRSYSITFKREW